MNFKKDFRWDIFESGKDFQTFKNWIMPNMFFKKAVPEDIINCFRVIKKLLLHSYYEYEFCDVATSKALLTLELALQTRYLELTGEKWTIKIKKGEQRRDLKNLISWFLDRNYFEISNINYLTQIRQIRNSYAHPKNYSYAGPAVTDLIQKTIDLINDVYENPDLRKQRIQLETELKRLLSPISNNGGIYRFGSFESIIFDIKILFINNKTCPADIFLLAYPLINKQELCEKNYYPILIKAKKIWSTRDIIYIETSDNGTVQILPLTIPAYQMIYNQWNKSLGELYPEVTFFLDRQLESGFCHCRREFHKIE